MNLKNTSVFRYPVYPLHSSYLLKPCLHPIAFKSWQLYRLFHLISPQLLILLETNLK